MMADKLLTVTLSRDALKFVLESSDNAAARARAFRSPHLRAHREAAELAYQRAKAYNAELFEQVALVVGENEGTHDLYCRACGTVNGCPVLQTEVHDA
jgi:hypothetical protein